MGKERIRTYSRKWETDPELKEWIQGIEGNTSQALCKYCKSILYPHRRALLDHAKTKKHQANMERVSLGIEIQPILIKSEIQPIANFYDNVQVTWTIGESSDGAVTSTEKIRRRTFNKNWESDPELNEWVRGVEGNSSQAFCKYCNCKLIPYRKVLLEHAQTKKHKRHMEQAINEMDVRPINRIFSNSEQFLSTVRKKNELRLIVCFIFENCNIEAVDHLGELLTSIKNFSSGFRNLSIDRTKSTALIVNVIAPLMHKGLIEDIGESYFSLIISECIGVSFQIFPVIIRYVSKSMKKIVSTFYKIITIEILNADSLTIAIYDAIEGDGLNLNKCIGLGIDGTSTLEKTLSLTSGQLKEKVPQIQVNKCICFLLNLIRSKVSEVLPQQLEFLIREIYNWFSHNLKRRQAYIQIFNISDNELPLKIIQSASTSWLSRGEYVARVIDQWDVLILHFKIAYDSEKCHTAKILYDTMSDTANKLYLIFLKANIGELNAISNLFQDEIAGPAQLLNNLVYYYKTLLQKLVIPTYFAKISNASELMNFKFKNYLMNTCAISFGYEFELECQTLNINEVLNVKENCKLMLITIVEELNFYIPSYLKMQKKLEILHPNKALQHVKPVIKSLAIEFKNICQNVGKTELEWNNLVHVEWTNKINEASFWFEVMDYHDSEGDEQYKHISKLALSLLTLPISNAAVDIVFSALNEVKSKIKNHCQINTINSLLQLKFNFLRIGKDYRTFQPSREMLDKFDETMYKIPSSALLE